MNKVAKSTVILMLVTMMSKVLGFIRELVLTYFYGTTQISDVYITSSTIPTIYGEKMVLRILNRQSLIKEKSELGFSKPSNRKNRKYNK